MKLHIMKMAGRASQTFGRVKKRATRLYSSRLQPRLFAWLPRPADFAVNVMSNHDEYRAHADRMQAEYARRRKLESKLVRKKEPFETTGYCFVCSKWVPFSSTWAHAWEADGVRALNWREHLTCPGCGLNNRMRAAIHLLATIVQAERNSIMYAPEQVTSLFARLREIYPKIRGSEFLGNSVPLGHENALGIRNESLTELSFGNGEFDIIANFEVMEHVPNFYKAFTECARTLRVGGKMIFTVPFNVNCKHNLIRARIHPDGAVEHLLEPEYHGDPMTPRGCLAFQVFGWEMLYQMKQAGFSSVAAMMYWSRYFGYLGVESVAFVAER